MTGSLLVVQMLNGLQLGIMLFLMAAGLTLVFGIMDMVNLAHGSFYMVGAFVAATIMAATGHFFVAAVCSVGAVVALGFLVEAVLLKHFYQRGHLRQVLVTFGLILVMDEVVRMLWGGTPQPYPVPPSLSGFVQLAPDVTYPTFRLVILAVGLLVAVLLYALVVHTRAGSWVRAGASDRAMAGALGIDVQRLFSAVFAAGCGLAAIAGLMTGPILAVQIGMGEPILILALVVMVIGGVGSIRGAFLAAVLVGLTDTFGRVLLPPALGSMTIFVLMALVLSIRPQGLFSQHA